MNADLHRLRRAAQEHVLGRECPPGAYALPYASSAADGDPGQEPPALGYFVPIEHESALEHFHQALSRLAQGLDEDGKVRILAYGASHTQADTYPGYLRAYLQSRFGNGGQGFVLLGRVNRWYRTLDTEAFHQKLTVHHARYKEDVQEEPLGLFGAALVGSAAGGYGEIVTAKDSPNTMLEVHYFKQPGGGGFSVQVDGRTLARIETRSDRPEPAYHAFETTPGSHRIRMRLHGNGTVRLLGIVTETADPGIVVDTLGIGGAEMANSLVWKEDAWIDAVHRRNPDLITLAYGTNEIMNVTLSIARYEQQLRAALTRVRKAAPEVSCLLIAPFDLRKKSRPRLLKVIDAQRRISGEFGCAFWDGYAFMGGAGSMRRWASVKPPLASADLVHLTRLGYVYAGLAIGDALMRAYDVDPAHSPGVGEAPSASTP